MEKAYEVALEFVKEREETFKNAWKILKKIKEAAVEILKDAKVYVFGSFARGDYKVYFSDIDVLIVSDKISEKMQERAEIKVEIRKRANANYIFQIHLVNSKEFEFYKKFVDKLVEI
ncbi:MAG: nucleotidyltransferase domain-containing protein [Candidatus Aenigmarchaeota archaeon]|jgi:predicted nucleotidyltransferase|nr:nucleotidyltransferase domain-containing protein [Candidatus Aenigmarchaeota archaeon]